LPPSCPNRTRDEFALDGGESHFQAHTGLLWKECPIPPARSNEPLVGFPGGFLPHVHANHLVLPIFLQAIAPWCPEKSQTKLLSRGVSLGIFDRRTRSLGRFPGILLESDQSLIQEVIRFNSGWRSNISGRSRCTVSLITANTSFWSSHRMLADSQSSSVTIPCLVSSSNSWMSCSRLKAKWVNAPNDGWHFLDFLDDT